MIYTSSVNFLENVRKRATIYEISDFEMRQHLVSSDFCRYELSTATHRLSASARVIHI